MGALAVFHLTNVLHYNHQIFQLQLYHELYCQGRELWSGKKTYICRHLRVLSLHEKTNVIILWYVQRKCRGLIRYNTNTYAIYCFEFDEKSLLPSRNEFPSFGLPASITAAISEEGDGGWCPPPRREEVFLRIRPESSGEWRVSYTVTAYVAISPSQSSFLIASKIEVGNFGEDCSGGCIS